MCLWLVIAGKTSACEKGWLLEVSDSNLTQQSGGQISHKRAGYVFLRASVEVSDSKTSTAAPDARVLSKGC
jgi:hypothetical protein